MGAQFTFAAGSDSIAIVVYGYENPQAKDLDDANWLDATVTVKAGPFAGSFKAALTTHELTDLSVHLGDALGALAGPVHFQNLEEDLSFTVEFNKLGQASILGFARPHHFRQYALQFRLDTDQSCLTQTLQELKCALGNFPVRHRVVPQT